MTRRRRVYLSMLAAMVVIANTRASAFTALTRLDGRRRRRQICPSSSDVSFQNRYQSSAWMTQSQNRQMMTTRLWYSPQEQDLEKMTIKELKQLLKDSNLVLERGVLSSLKRKQDWIDFLKENLRDKANGESETLEQAEAPETVSESVVEEAPATAITDEATEKKNIASADTAKSTHVSEENDNDSAYDMPIEYTYQDYKKRLEELLLEESNNNAATAAERAQEMFDEMYEAFMFGYEHLEPEVDIYNLLISAYGRALNAQMAQLILDRMLGPENNLARPNVETFVQVMEAWCNVQAPTKAQQVFERLQQCHEAAEDKDSMALKPTTEAYNTLIKAWLKSSIVNPNEAAEKAESILREMLSEPDAKPNVKTWERVIKCISAIKTTESTNKVMELLEEMQTLGQKPETEVYNAVIRAIALNRDSSNRKTRGAMAESILYEMMTDYKSGKNLDARPNVGTFINVMYAFRGSPEQSAGYKAEKLLELLEGMSLKEHDLVPNVRVYNAVIDVIGRTRDANKAPRCLRVFERMKDHGIQPNIRTYNAILNACAYTYSKDPQELMQAFRIAVEIMNELRHGDENDPSLQPNAVSYGLFLTSCARLMPHTQKRETVVENMFRKCCMDGQVNDFVLESMQEAAPEELQEKLLKDKKKQWSRNVVPKRQAR